jgi:hypothetical protein
VIVGRDALFGHGVGDGVLEEFLQTCDKRVPGSVGARKNVSCNLGVCLPHTTAELAA